MLELQPHARAGANYLGSEAHTPTGINEADLHGSTGGRDGCATGGYDFRRAPHHMAVALAPMGGGAERSLRAMVVGKCGATPLRTGLWWGRGPHSLQDNTIVVWR